MCGRFSLTTDPELLAEHFDLDEVPNLEPRYNIAPTQDVAVVKQPAEGGRRRLETARWGLFPPGGIEPSSAPMINARCETVMEKPSFRVAFLERRCLILADGFFEWKRVGGRKQPIYFKLRDHTPFAFAGIWERWTASDGHPVDSCAILTTEPNDQVRTVHDRMPVILPRSAYVDWLDPSPHPREVLKPLLRPFPAAEMHSHPVSPTVNNVANEGPECVAPYQVVTQQDLFA